MFGKEDPADIGGNISKCIADTANSYILKPGGSLYERATVFKRGSIALLNKVYRQFHYCDILSDQSFLELLVMGKVVFVMFSERISKHLTYGEMGAPGDHS